MYFNPREEISSLRNIVERKRTYEVCLQKVGGEWDREKT